MARIQVPLGIDREVSIEPAGAESFTLQPSRSLYKVVVFRGEEQPSPVIGMQVWSRERRGVSVTMGDTYSPKGLRVVAKRMKAADNTSVVSSRAYRCRAACPSIPQGEGRAHASRSIERQEALGPPYAS